ncbi:MAG: ABC transporter ATP-binding protein [Ignavibacteria bacterium]|nr:ABC transporter ATP-binding protein [Ignavibacteria bacterium]
MKNLRKLYHILDKWKPFYILSGVLLILSTSIRMLEPKILQIAVDKIIVYFQSGKNTIKVSEDWITNLFYSFLPELKLENLDVILIYLGIVFLVISLMRGLFMFFSSAITASSTEKATKKLRDRLFSHIQALPIAYHSKTPTGELIQRCTGDVETVRKFASTQLVEVLRMIAIFSSAFFMMVTINLTYAFIAIALVPFIAIGSVVFFRKESKIWNQHEKEQDKLSVIVQENLSGIRVVKAFAKEKYEMNKFTKQNLEKRNWGIKLLRLHTFFWPLSDFLVYTQIAVSIFAGGYFALTNQISVGEFVAFYSYAMLVTWPMRRLGQLVSEMGMTSVAIKRIYSILDFEAEDYSGSKYKERKIEGNIEFQNVMFRYDKKLDEHVLKGISFNVKKGEKIALLGPTGSGKSTIISLLMRFFEPDKGLICIDGIPLKTYSKGYLRSRIGVVLQKPFLFTTTIKDNISYSKPDSELDDVIDYSRVAQIHDIITEIFPESYDTVVGEKGVTLSGGQKQRVTIARTLLKNPDILILDDSTSSVDTETEFEIQKALRQLMKGKTTFIIAHRITSIQDADRIIILDKGKIVESGTHDELLRQNGFYRKIFDIQVSIEEEIEKEVLT